MKLPLPQKYSARVRFLHWLTAALIIGTIPLAWYMTQLDDTVESKFKLFAAHQSIGVLILLLTLIRLKTKSMTKNPDLPNDLTPLDRRMALVTHWSLYGLLILVPLIGITMTMVSGYKVPFFFFEFPNVLPEHKVMGRTLESFHTFLGYSILVLLGLHLTGIAKEFIYHKRNLLKRMV